MYRLTQKQIKKRSKPNNIRYFRPVECRCGALIENFTDYFAGKHWRHIK